MTCSCDASSTYLKSHDAWAASRARISARLVEGHCVTYPVEECGTCHRWRIGAETPRTTFRPRPNVCAMPSMRRYRTVAAAEQAGENMGLSIDPYRCATCDMIHFTATAADNAAAGPRTCPHGPDTPTFATMAAAVDHRSRLPRPDRWFAHLCVCGSWHLTPPRGRLDKSWFSAAEETGCPTPDKKAMSGISAARKVAKSMARDPNLRAAGYWGPYMCVCGKWHVAAYETTQEAAKALRESKETPGSYRPRHGAAKRDVRRGSPRPKKRTYTEGERHRRNLEMVTRALKARDHRRATLGPPSL